MAFLLSFAFALAALVSAAWWVLARRRRRAPPRPAVPVTAASAPVPGSAVAPAPGGAGLGGAPAGWRGAAELAQAEREGLAHRLERIPRPPRLLDQLLSREFVNSASARALADLIVADPVLAARVLKTVNSPYHGLRQPVGSVEQAVQHLGTTAIRVVCLRYLFVAAFPVDDFSRRRALQDGWACSALSADLAQHLWPALGLPDVGHWSSALVMSWLGRLAAVAGTGLDHLGQRPALRGAMLARWEQDQWGLAAPELGRFLMGHWGLPEATVWDATAMAWAPVAGLPPTAGDALVAAALCAHLADALVEGRLPNLAAWEPAADAEAGALGLAQWPPERLAPWLAALRGPALDQAVRRSLGAWTEGI